MVRVIRSLKLGLTFGVIGTIFAIAASSWVFGVRNERAFSTLDIMLLWVAMWPQLLAEQFGLSCHSSLASLSLNCFGWTIVGLVLGALWKKTHARSHPII